MGPMMPKLPETCRGFVADKSATQRILVGFAPEVRELHRCVSAGRGQDLVKKK